MKKPLLENCTREVCCFLSSSAKIERGVTITNETLYGTKKFYRESFVRLYNFVCFFDQSVKHALRNGHR
jgi:hypothetical protein